MSEKIAENITPKNIIPEFIKNLPLQLGICVSYKGNNVFSFNEGMVFPAASIVKIPLCLLILKKVQDNKLELDQVIDIDQKVGGSGIVKDLTIKAYSIRDLITLALIVSDNTASNTLINLCSFEEINSFIHSYGLVNTCLNRKFMVDLVNPPVNFVTASEMNLLLCKLLNYEILSKHYSLMFIDILLKQQYREKIPLFLKDVLVANKTGDISGISHDSGIVFLESNIEKAIEKGNFYVVTILTSFSKQVSRDLVNNIIGEISLNIYRWIGGI
ncbi:MAG: serine hydrolase [bacterium]